MNTTNVLLGNDEFIKVSNDYAIEEQLIFEKNKEAFFNSLNTLKEMVNVEVEDIETRSKMTKEDRWNQFKKDCCTMGGYRKSEKGNKNTWPADTCKFDNTLFGPVGIMWNTSLEKCQSIAATTMTFNRKETSKEDCYRFIKENRPLIYYIGTNKLGHRKIDFWNPLKDGEPTWDCYMIRYFPTVGKLPWWKYQLQFLFNKINPKWVWLRSMVYRTLVIK